MKLRVISILFFLAFCLVASAAKPKSDVELFLIPQPQSVKMLSERRLALGDKEPSVRMDAPSNWNDERYTLSITPKGIEITARSPQGVIWAQRTLRQLRGADGTYPHLRIDDWPEFPLRGFMYDDGRNFVGVDRIKKFLDFMSEYKLNLFHWHLTDKPAWRIQSFCFPQLNDGKFQRPGRDQGLFYTYDQIREVIAYARERGITVLPEIDMPGHSDFFQTTFGFSMDSPQGREVLEKCLNEFFREIPADLCPMIHIGSDEVNARQPEVFMKWAQELVRSNGRTPFVWDPGLPADSLTVRQCWREADPENSFLPEASPFVDSAMGYLNYYDPMQMPARIFFHTPCGSGKVDDKALGGIACLWNDVRVADKDKLAAHNGMAGGVMAFADRFWRGGVISGEELGSLYPEPDSKAMMQFEAFQNRVANHKQRFHPDELSYWERIHANPWRVEIDADTIHRSFVAWGDILNLDELCLRHGIPADTPVSCSMTRTVVSSVDRTARFKIGFEAPARSNRRSDGIASQGHWPNYGHIEVNGVPVAPPRWLEPDTYRYHYPTWARLEEELPYTDEQLYWMREPLKIPLKAGENTVKMTLRRHFPGQVFQASFIECE